MKCTAKRPAIRHNFLEMDHPDAYHINLHPRDSRYVWYECPHCGCVIGKTRKKREKKEHSGVGKRISANEPALAPSQPHNHPQPSA